MEVLPVELQGLVVAEKVVTAARISRVGDWLGFSEVTAWGDESSTRSSLTPEKEVRACFRNLEGASPELQPGAVAHRVAASSARPTLRHAPLPRSPHPLPLQHLDGPLPLHQRHLFNLLRLVSTNSRLRSGPHARLLWRATQARGSCQARRRRTQVASRSKPQLLGRSEHWTLLSGRHRVLSPLVSSSPLTRTNRSDNAFSSQVKSRSSPPLSPSPLRPTLRPKSPSRSSMFGAWRSRRRKEGGRGGAMVGYAGLRMSRVGSGIDDWRGRERGGRLSMER